MRGTRTDVRLRRGRQLTLAMVIAGVLAGPLTATAGAHPRVAHPHPTAHHRAPIHLVYGHKVG